MDSPPEAIRPLLEAWADALRHKDLDALARCYADDVRVYDIGSQVEGFGALRELWDSCFPFFVRPIEIERKDIRAAVGDHVIAMSFLSRATGHDETDPAASSWYRSTMVFEKGDDGWRITQEHSSIAFDFANNKIALILDRA